MASGEQVQEIAARKPLSLENGQEIQPLPRGEVLKQTDHDIFTFDGFRHELYTTLPKSLSSTSPHIFIYPGFLEHAGEGIGKRFHETLASFLPHANITSTATDGFGPRAEHRYGWKDRTKHNLEAMGYSRAALIEEIVPEAAPIIFVGTSMGTIIIKEVAKSLSEKRQSQVSGGVLNAPALVEQGSEDDKFAHLRAFGRFIFSTVPDVAVEIFKTPPKHLLSELSCLVDSGHLSKDDILPLGNLLIDILGGSKTADIDYMLGCFNEAPFSVVLGSQDPVGEYKKWLLRQALHKHLNIVPVEGRSHGIVINPVRNGRVVARELYEHGIIEPLEAAA